MTLLWMIHGEQPIHIFGGGPPTTVRWHDARIEHLVAGAEVFWNEIPAFAADDVRLAPRYGIDPDAPLPAWLSERDLARVEAAAATVGVNPQQLRPLRPWLTAQVLKRAAQTAAGFTDAYAAEVVLANIARSAGVPVRSEMPNAEATFDFFSSLPRESEIAFLSMTLDEIEAGLDTIRRDAEAVANGDASVGDRLVGQLRDRYPHLYGPLLPDRNRRWVGRVRRMLQARERAFIYVGSAHLAGPDSVQAMLHAVGIEATPEP